jgi:hypothetical protein
MVDKLRKSRLVPQPTDGGEQPEFSKTNKIGDAAAFFWTSRVGGIMMGLQSSTIEGQPADVTGDPGSTSLTE